MSLVVIWLVFQILTVTANVEQCYSCRTPLPPDIEEGLKGFMFLTDTVSAKCGSNAVDVSKIVPCEYACGQVKDTKLNFVVRGCLDTDIKPETWKAFNADVTVLNSLPPICATKSMMAMVGIDAKLIPFPDTTISEPVVKKVLKCETLNEIENGDEVAYSNDQITDGTTATFECDDGYVLVGSAVRTCKDSKWTEEPPVCSPKSETCPRLEPVQNGKPIVYSDKEYIADTTASFECKKGFNLKGSVTRICDEDGQWSNSSPVCEAICSKVDEIPNGSVVYSSKLRNPGSTRTVTCMNGYSVIDGNEETRCMEDGQWEHELPECSLRRCKMLATPHSGRMEYSDSTMRVGTTATFKCDAGLTLKGDSKLTCNDDVKWSARPPECITICTKIKAVKNGDVQYSSMTRERGSSLKVTCYNGFVLEDSKTKIRHCQPNGVWAGKAAVCIAKCDIPKKIKNADVKLSDVSVLVGTRLEIKCEAGFELKGPSIRECLANRTWSGSRPSCVLTKCKPLEPIANSDPIKYSKGAGNLEIGSTARYTCISGFVMKGSSFRTCNDDVIWSGRAPVCTREGSCAQVDAVRNSLHVNYSDSNRKIDSTASISCKPNYTLLGDSKRTCQQNLSWSGKSPTCKGQQCVRLGEILFSESVVYHDKNVDHTETATIKCQPAYELKGSPILTCDTGGKWSDKPPTCVRLGSCGPLPEVKNAAKYVYSDPDNMIVGSVVRVTCKRRYIMQGDSKLKCAQSLVWKGITTTCKIQCEPLPRMQRGRLKVKDNRRLEGSVVYIVCDKGYVPQSNTTVVCLSNTKWSSRPKSCRVATNRCSKVESIDHGIPSYSKKNLAVGTNVTYECKEGYELVGPSVRRCTKQEMWSQTSPRCVKSAHGGPKKAVRCSRLKNIKNARDLKYSEGATEVNSTVQYSCMDGFRVVGLDERKCLPTGRWTNRAPTCKAKCKPLEMRNGISEYSEEESRVTVKCKKNFALSGEATGECGFDGLWKGVTATCEAIHPDGTTVSEVEAENTQIQGTTVATAHSQVNEDAVGSAAEVSNPEPEHVATGGAKSDWMRASEVIPSYNAAKQDLGHPKGAESASPVKPSNPTVNNITSEKAFEKCVDGFMVGDRCESKTLLVLGGIVACLALVAGILGAYVLAVQCTKY